MVIEIQFLSPMHNISSIQYPHVASGYHLGQHRCRTQGNRGGSFPLSVLPSLSAGIFHSHFYLPQGIKALFQGWCCYEHPGPQYGLKVSTWIILTGSQKNLEADGGLHLPSRLWAIWHTLFPIPLLWYKACPFWFSKKSAEVKKKPGTLTVSCFLSALTFPPTAV